MPALGQSVELEDLLDFESDFVALDEESDFGDESDFEDSEEVEEDAFFSVFSVFSFFSLVSFGGFEVVPWSFL